MILLQGIFIFFILPLVLVAIAWLLLSIGIWLAGRILGN